MFTFLRILSKALETEKDRINERKLTVDEIGVYESILNYNFTDTDVNSSIVIDSEDADLEIKWDLTRHGKTWTNEDIQNLFDMCYEGKSILEMLVKSGRKIGPLIRKLNEYGWYFEKVENNIRLVQYEIIENDFEAQHTINYKPKHFSFGYIEIKKSWLSTEAKFEFKYPFTGVDKKDLDIEFFHNDNSKIIEINKDFSSYTLHAGGNEIFNSTFQIKHPELGEVTIHNGKPNDYFINLLYYFKKNKVL
jgi:hypothetical protein